MATAWAGVWMVYTGSALGSSSCGKAGGAAPGGGRPLGG